MAKICVSSAVEFFLFWSLCLLVEKACHCFYYCLTHHCVCSIYVAQSLLLVFYIQEVV